ncbi:PsbP-related protein [Pustulibacterium marinum]|nr:PsbP-related protein [Pustulibacterium marinum]
MKTRFLVCLAFIFSLVSTAQSDIKSFQNKLYELSYPANFEVNNNYQSEHISVIVSDTLHTESDVFTENLTVIFQQGVSQTLDDAKGEFLSAADAISNGNIISEQLITVHGKEAYRIQFTAEQQEYELMLIQQYIITKDYLFMLTFTGMASDFENYKEAAETMLNSFMIK